MTEEQVKAWIAFLKTNPPKARCRFRDGNACCAIGYALELFRPFAGQWKQIGPLDMDVYVYHHEQAVVTASAKLGERLLEALGLDSEIEYKIAQKSDITPGWDSVIRVIERELA